METPMNNADREETRDQRVAQKVANLLGVGTSRLKSPHGMTLVEIMIVVTIMAMIASVVGVFVFGALDRANIRTAQIEIGQLEGQVEQYYTMEGELPDQLEDLTEGPRPYIEGEVPEDPWGNDYIYDRQGSQQFEIYSAGPDEVEGTEEDVFADD